MPQRHQNPAANATRRRVRHRRRHHRPGGLDRLQTKHPATRRRGPLRVLVARLLQGFTGPIALGTLIRAPPKHPATTALAYCSLPTKSKIFRFTGKWVYVRGCCPLTLEYLASGAAFPKPVVSSDQAPGLRNCLEFVAFLTQLVERACRFGPAAEAY